MLTNGSVTDHHQQALERFGAIRRTTTDIALTFLLLTILSMGGWCCSQS